MRASAQALTTGTALDSAYTPLASSVIATILTTAPSSVTVLIAVAIDAGLSTLIFSHAHRRRNPHATAWGVFTFLAAMIAIPLYFLTYTIRRLKQRR